MIGRHKVTRRDDAIVPAVGCHVTLTHPAPLACKQEVTWPGVHLAALSSFWEAPYPTPPQSQAQPPSSTSLRGGGAPGNPNTSHLHTRVPNVPKGWAKHQLPGRGLCKSRPVPLGNPYDVNHTVGAACSWAGDFSRRDLRDCHKLKPQDQATSAFLLESPFLSQWGLDLILQVFKNNKNIEKYVYT